MLVNPQAILNQSVEDYVWARATELPEYLPAAYADVLGRLTLD